MGIPSDISEDKWLNKGGWEVIVLEKKMTFCVLDI